jgi:large subunit ribosomal protein L7e
LKFHAYTFRVTQEALLKKRKRDDENQRKRLDVRAKARMDRGRKRKMEEKEKTGKKILMPEVFISNYNKQQRNYVNYKRQKTRLSKSAPKQTEQGVFNVAPFETITPYTLILAVRVKESNNVTPQAQKILNLYGLKEVNNAVFLHSTPDVIKSLLMIQNYVAFGYPQKALVNDLIRKRGSLKKEDKRMPITDNNLIEELLGKATDSGVICIEDIIASVTRCDDHFEKVRSVLWPIQLHPLKETSTKAVTKHDATGLDIKKRNTKVVKGGYLGLMGDKINDYVKPLI